MLTLARAWSLSGLDWAGAALFVPLGLFWPAVAGRTIWALYIGEAWRAARSRPPIQTPEVGKPMSEPAPSIQQILGSMRVSMGEVLPAIEKAARADARIVAEQARSSAFAMPPEDGALDPETRTLIHLAVALATSNQACTLTMLNKARTQSIAAPKLLEAVDIARFALATQVLGNAEPVFDLINEHVADPGPRS